MTMIGDLIPISNPSNSSKKMLDLTYRHSAILFSDAIQMGLSAAGVQSNFFIDNFVTLPLVGFVFENPSQIELLKYQYSEYPYLNKSLIVNSYVRQNVRFTLVAHKLITANNTVPINIAANEALFQLLQLYCNRGGTFTIVTMWGIYNNCVLEELNGIPPSAENGVGGTSFEFRFLRLGFNNNILKSISNGLKALSKGIL